ncbi:MAG: hypothetical protein ACRC5T_10735 [Cetobacterium sp.]
MTEKFEFTDEQWRKYQSIPEQGYSHRHHPEYVFNQWLEEHDREVRVQIIEQAADEWPIVTRDMVSRGRVRQWLLEFAELLKKL